MHEAKSDRTAKGNKSETQISAPLPQQFVKATRQKISMDVESLNRTSH